jgi:hypothetical protein
LIDEIVYESYGLTDEDHQCALMRHSGIRSRGPVPVRVPVVLLVRPPDV